MSRAQLQVNECQNYVSMTCPANGSLPGIEVPTDRLGVVYFDDHSIGCTHFSRPRRSTV